ncbi:uncharacterized protein LOC141661765 isoform X2 [Apium graveolens]|uniref:uncharacterized protein LOC141661765 isoform X2 n=1 Tax=Apium graveolens TaxID=4045 RepID=UPI003D78B844
MVSIVIRLGIPTGGGISTHYAHPFGFNPGAFGHSSHPFGFNPSNGGSSTPAFGHYNRPFGFTPTGGGTSAPSLGQINSFGFTPTTPFGSAPANGGTSVPTFGKNSTSSFGSAPANGGTSVPAFGQNSTTPFGTSPANGGTSVPALGQISTPFGYAPANGGTSMPIFAPNSTSFGSTPVDGGTSVPTFGQNSTTSFGGAPANGGISLSTFGKNSNETPVPTFGQNSTTSFGGAPANGGTSVPTFGQITTFGCAPANDGTSLPAFARSTNPSGFTPLILLGQFPPMVELQRLLLGKGELILCLPQTPKDGGTSVPFHSLGSTSFSQTPAVNASSSPGFGFGCPTTCSQPTLPAGRSLSDTGSHLFGTQNHISGSTAYFQTLTMNASSSPGFGFACTTSGHATTPLGTSSNLFGTNTCSGEIQVPFTGDQVKIPSSGSSSSESFTFSVNCGGTRATTYTETVELEGNPQLSTRIMSISAMPVFRDKCHEELRWEDRQLGDNVLGNIPLFHRVRAGQSAIGSQSKGSKVKPYTKTMVGEDTCRATSISAMLVYQDKSDEETISSIMQAAELTLLQNN